VNDHQISLISSFFAVVGSILAVVTMIINRGEKGGTQSQQLLNAVLLLEQLKNSLETQKSNFESYKGELGRSITGLTVDNARLEERIKSLKEGSEGFSETTGQFAGIEPRLRNIEDQIKSLSKEVSKSSNLATRWSTWCEILASRIQSSGRMRLELGMIPLPKKEEENE
jgi:predicted  nucleic acid-binding Zn-ribbon protein